MRNTILSVLIFYCFAVTANAQVTFGEYAARDGLRLLEIGRALTRMPRTGARPEDFVPPHWAITDRAEGDLNEDGVKDWVFTLMLDERDANYLEALAKLGNDDLWIDRTFMIVVVDSRADRKMHFSAVNYNLYGDSDMPARGGDGRDEFSLAIKKNVLEIHLDYGGMLRTRATFRFRSQKLIGFDAETTCVLLNESCRRFVASENYLTATRIETDYKITADKMIGAEKRTKIAPVDVDFMNARLNLADGKGGLRPF